MKLFPAIDLLDGQVVRLYQGAFDQKTIYHQSPLEALDKLIAMGAQSIHVVDLDAAKGEGKNNRDLIGKLVKYAPNLPIQVGGGIRTYEEAKALLDQGVDKIVLGSLLFTDEITFKRLVSDFGSRIVVALDIKDGYVRHHGWQIASGSTIRNVYEAGKLSGVHSVMVTDIDKDGASNGPNVELMGELMTLKGIRWIASGGVRNKSDLLVLKQLGIYGTILGRAIYEGDVEALEDLKD
jgi:phosphoribosylformimino-5-aminoimidazole carboxamide ribotide isomerase